MTQKLYWDDPYKYEFSAEITKLVEADQRLGIVLEGTHFYPEGGGQPSDRGRIGHLAVVDVQELGEDIVHYVDAKQAANADLSVHSTVACKIDFELRRQNMRAHTGAHVLFGAARKLFSKLEYAGFDIHGSGGSLYLRTDGTITSTLMYKMLDRANTAVVDDRSIGTYFVKPEEVASIRDCVYNVELPRGKTRIVTIDGWDIAVCSGTHLARTIEIGPVQITNREAHKKGVTRLDYVVGHAAVTKLMEDEQMLGTLGLALNAPRADVSKAAERLMSTLAEERKKVGQLQERLAEFRLQELLAHGSVIGEIRACVGEIRDVGQDAIRSAIANSLKKQQKTIIAIVGATDDRFIVAGRTNDLDLDIRSMIMPLASQFGGKGGGGPHLVFMGGIASSPDSVLKGLRTELKSILG